MSSHVLPTDPWLPLEATLKNQSQPLFHGMVLHMLEHSYLFSPNLFFFRLHSPSSSCHFIMVTVLWFPTFPPPQVPSLLSLPSWMLMKYTPSIKQTGTQEEEIGKVNRTSAFLTVTSLLPLMWYRSNWLLWQLNHTTDSCHLLMTTQAFSNAQGYRTKVQNLELLVTNAIFDCSPLVITVPRSSKYCICWYFIFLHVNFFIQFKRNILNT